MHQWKVETRVVALALLLWGQSILARPQTNVIPSLEELAGHWQDAASLRSLPALNNTRGAAKSTNGVLAVADISFPPITMAGETGVMLIDGQAPQLKQARWFPYQVLRRATAGNIAVETAVRMPCEENGFLFHIALANTCNTAQTFTLKINLSANTSRHERWGWNIPIDKDASRFSAVAMDGGQTLLLRETHGELANCFSFDRKPDELLVQEHDGAALWRITLKQHSSFIINFALAVGGNDGVVHDAAVNWAGHFDSAFAQVEHGWQERFEAMFRPNNRFFPGHLPLLVTPDEKLRRVYYLSAVSILSLYRTSFPMAPRVYVNDAPEYNCISMYFWNTREWATSLALLDPVMLKEYLRSWLAKDIYRGYSEEFLTGTLQGPWYSANDYCIFLVLDSYLNVTGDRAFLLENINGKTVLERMDAIATHWKTLVRDGRTLADYGEKKNLLECVPTYIHEVPSFNAANVWMMRRAAAIQESEGNRVRAQALRADAKRLLPAVLALYEPGQGVWDSLHRDGTRVQMRHVFDFATIGLTIKEDLSPKVRQEMTGFVERELLTDHWMRAQSLTDPAAGNSDRPDHGPMGAYSAWPAETMAVMCEFGKFDQALDLLHRCAGVTFEGPFSQSRELLGRTPDAPVRIASRGLQCYNNICGAAFVETTIREFFGYQPDCLGRTLIPDPSARGFRGRLLNLRQGSQLFDLTSTRGGIQIIPANRR